MSDNRLGLTDDEYETMARLAAIAGVSGDFVERAVWAASADIGAKWEWVTFSPCPLCPHDDKPDDPKQRARERSTADRRRKSRGGKYKWGGALDE